MRIATILAASVALGASAWAVSPVPRPAKEFDFVEPSGKHTLMSSQKGKVVLVQFLYTTCPHCQAMSQMLTKLQQEYGPRGLQILGAAFNPEADPNTVKAYIQQFNVGFPVGVANRDSVMGYLGISAMERFVVPQVAVIDRKGVVVAQTEANPTNPKPPLQDEAYLRTLIDKLLKESASGASKGATPATSKAPAAKGPTSAVKATPTTVAHTK
jgi:thiol-disulfide isomerase/thioredoxin